MCVQGDAAMDNFELKTEPKVKRKPIIWNILTVIVLLGVCGLAYLFLTIYQNPGHAPRQLPARRASHPLPDSHPHGYHHPPAPTWTPTLTIQPSPTAYQGSHLDIRRGADHADRHHDAYGYSHR